MPRVSVCIPTYNCGRFLGETIESVLRQEYADYELIVCDNASTDNTSELCRTCTDPRMRYVRYEQLVGQAGNWNRSLELAKGDYIILLHADDVLLPRYLTRAVAVLEKEPTVGMVHCAVRHIRQDGSPLDLQQLYSEDRIDPGIVRFRQLLFQGCVINPAGVLVRRSVYEAVGRFAEEVAWGIDWHMWLRVALAGNVAYLSEPLALYRLHPQNGTSGVMVSGRNGKDEMWVVKDLFQRIPAQRKDLHALNRQARRQVAHRTWCHAEQMCRADHMAAARAGIRQAIAIHPGMLLQKRLWSLLAATYIGYGWFDYLLHWKRRLWSGHAGST